MRKAPEAIVLNRMIVARSQKNEDVEYLVKWTFNFKFMNLLFNVISSIAFPMIELIKFKFEE